MITALTPREREVMELVRDGHTNAEIGASLGISEHTVELHCGNAYAKLGVSGQGSFATRREGALRYALLNPRRPEPRRRKAVQAESLGLELV